MLCMSVSNKEKPTSRGSKVRIMQIIYAFYGDNSRQTIYKAPLISSTWSNAAVS